MPVMDSRHAAAANRLITWGRLARRCRGTHVAPDYRANGASRSHGAGSVANLQEAMPPTRTHLKGAYRWRFFFAFRNVEGADNAIRGRDDEASYRIVAQRKLESLAGVLFVLRYWIHGLGNVRAAGSVCLQAAVAITDSGWIFSRCARAQRLDRARHTGKLVSVRGRKAACPTRHFDLGDSIADPAVSRRAYLLHAAHARCVARRGRRQLCHRAADGGEQLSATSAGLGLGTCGRRYCRRPQVPRPSPALVADSCSPPSAARWQSWRRPRRATHRA